MKKSYVFLSLLLTIILGYVFSFLYQPEINTGVSQKTGRIDISTPLKDNEKAPFTVKYKKENLFAADWMKNNKRFGYVIENKDQRAEFEITANRDCEITLNLRGPWILKDPNNRNAGIFEQWIDFKRVKINGKNILKKVTPVWHNKPFNHTFKVRQNETVHLKARWKKHYEKTDISLLFIVLVLSFLFSYKVVKYLASFKVLELRSRIDIVFLSLFAVILFLPMSDISTAEKSTKENRMLAKKPHFLLSNGRINTTYGTEFENWFNDRFLGRSLVIKNYTRLRYKFLRHIKNDLAIKSDDDMIFNIENIKNLRKKLTNTEIEKIAQNIKKLAEFSSENGIKLYVMIPPAKEDVCIDKLNFIYTENNEIYLKNAIDTLEKKTHIHFIYPRNIYLTKHKEFTHFKTDHHWTEYGAYLGYKELIKEIKKDFPKLTILNKEDFRTFYFQSPRLGSYTSSFKRPYYRGSDCSRLSLNENCPLNYDYLYFDFKNKNNLRVTNGPLKMSWITHYDKGIAANVTILGNSWGGFLMEFLPYNFSNVQLLRVNNEEPNVSNVYLFKRFEKAILDFKTDILIFYVQSPAIRDIMNLF